MSEELGKMIAVEITVKVIIDPERHAEEYGDDVEAVRKRVAGDVAAQVADLVSTQDGYGGFSHAAHWLSTSTEWRLAPDGDDKPGTHRDALQPGFRNPYDSERGEFKALCVCGQVFWGSDPWNADCAMLEHCEEMANCHHERPDDSPEPGDRCKDCGIPLTWVGPGQYDYEPAS